MTPGIAVCLSMIIVVLTFVLIRVQRALVIVTKNQQRLYVCFREMLKQVCPNEEKSLLLTVERMLNNEES